MSIKPYKMYKTIKMCIKPLHNLMVLKFLLAALEMWGYAKEVVATPVA